MKQLKQCSHIQKHLLKYVDCIRHFSTTQCTSYYCFLIGLPLCGLYEGTLFHTFDTKLGPKYTLIS